VPPLIPDRDDWTPGSNVPGDVLGGDGHPQGTVGDGMGLLTAPNTSGRRPRTEGDALAISPFASTAGWTWPQQAHRAGVLFP
jgi:hypothetical protein